MTQEAKIIIGVGLVTIAFVFGVAFFTGGSQTPQSSGSSKADPKLLVRQDSNKTSSGSAKVTLVEFGDYQCPACASAHPLVKQLINANKEKVTFVFRNFPLPQHQNAQLAAEAAEAAGAQGKYWEMHDKLYENQNQWAENSHPLDIFLGYAKTLGLDTEKFKKEIESNIYQDKINSDEQDGNTLGVNSTPTFYINNQKFVGNDLKGALDSVLSAN